MWTTVYRSALTGTAVPPKQAKHLHDHQELIFLLAGKVSLKLSEKLNKQIYKKKKKYQ